MLKHCGSIFGYQSIVCHSWTAITTLIQFTLPGLEFCCLCIILRYREYFLWPGNLGAYNLGSLDTLCNHSLLKSCHLLRLLSQSICGYCLEGSQISFPFQAVSAYQMHHLSFLLRLPKPQSIISSLLPTLPKSLEAGATKGWYSAWGVAIGRMHTCYPAKHITIKSNHHWSF